MSLNYFTKYAWKHSTKHKGLVHLHLVAVGHTRQQQSFNDLKALRDEYLEALRKSQATSPSPPAMVERIQQKQPLNVLNASDEVYLEELRKP
jgi:hypothetical protein